MRRDGIVGKVFVNVSVCLHKNRLAESGLETTTLWQL